MNRLAWTVRSLWSWSRARYTRAGLAVHLQVGYNPSGLNLVNCTLPTSALRSNSTTVVRGERVPLIKFPRRQTPEGKSLVALSPNYFHQLQQPEGVDGGRGLVVDLPASYGRKPLSEEEIESINLGGAT